jgi:hypothetical protein
VEIQMLHAATEGEIDSAFASLAQAQTGALLVPDDIFFNDRITQLVALAARFGGSPDISLADRDFRF